MKLPGASLVAQTVKNLPAVQETQVWSLDGEGPLQKGMAAHSSILAWRIPWTEEPGGLQSVGLQSQTRLKRLSTHIHASAKTRHVLCLVTQLPPTLQPQGL